MAAIEALLYSHLSADVALAALVSNRIYPDRLPQGVTYPAIRYVVIDSPPVHVKPTMATVRHVRARVQLDVYARTFAAVKDVEAALVTALYAFDRTVNSAIVETRVADRRNGADGEPAIASVSIDAAIVYND